VSQHLYSHCFLLVRGPINGLIDLSVFVMGYIKCLPNGHLLEIKVLSSRLDQRTVRAPHELLSRKSGLPSFDGDFSHSALSPSGDDVSILASSLTLAHADYSWRGASICRDTDPDLFFPIGTTGHALTQIARAKEVCGECPVSERCLEFALETSQDSGIWGGTSEEERRVMRRAQVARNKTSLAS